MKRAVVDKQFFSANLILITLHVINFRKCVQILKKKKRGVEEHDGEKQMLELNKGQKKVAPSDEQM